MMALPATVLEAEAVVSTASAGACTLTSGDAGTSRSADGRSHLPAGVAALARRLAPDGSRGAASAAGSTCVRFSSAIGDGVSFLASRDPI